LFTDDTNIHDDGTRVHSTLVGTSCISAHHGLWADFLATSQSTSARLAQGEDFVSVFKSSYANSIQLTAQYNAVDGDSDSRNGVTKRSKSKSLKPTKKKKKK